MQINTSLIPRTLILLMSTLLFACTTQAASKTELDAKVRAALTSLRQTQPAADELMNKAAGILIFPRVYKAGAGLGGELGEGALIVGGTTHGYYRLTALSLGFQLGGQAKTEAVLFMDRTALDEFIQSEGWEAGVDGSIAVIEFGVGKEIDTHNVRDPIVGFVFDNKGLMYDLSFEGTKFWRIQK